MIKKSFKLSIIFLLFIPYFIEGKAFFAENYIKDNYSDVNTKFDDFETLLPTDDPFYTYTKGNSLVLNQNYILKFNDVESKEENIKKPPLNVFRITGEICTGFGLGILTGLASFAVVYFIREKEKVSEVWVLHLDELDAASLIGGYIIGSAIGVYHIGNMGSETGSFITTLLGTILGACAWVIPAPIGATIGFNLTRKYKTPMETQRYKVAEVKEKKGKEFISDVKLSEPLTPNSIIKLEVSPNDILSIRDRLTNELSLKGFNIVIEGQADYILRFLYSVDKNKRLIGFTAYIVNSSTGKIVGVANFQYDPYRGISITEIIKEFVNQLCPNMK